MNHKASQQGFSLIELMIASLLGLLVSYAVLQIYLIQSQFYKTSNSQALILSTKNAIVNLLSPTIRSAGFLGCATTTTAISNLNTGAPDPLGSINTTPSMVAGYNGSGATYTFTQTNPANSTTGTDWSPTLPTSLTGQVEQGTDVLIVLGAMPNTFPIGVTQIDTGSNSLGLQSTTNTTISAGQLGAVSDCVKSIIFQITGASGTSVTHAAGSGGTQNASDTFPVDFQTGSQFIQLQQTAFFVGQGHGGQSSLMRGILTSSGWTVEPLVPGVEFMKVQYGTGDNGLISQYRSANSVTDWTRVYAVRIGFLIAGKVGSANTASTYNVLDTIVTVPADNLLRHTFEMTIHLRNSI